MTTSSSIRPGDIMFVTPGHDSLTKMIATYDGSPFSHVGIALGHDEMASCRTDDDMLAAGDIGGVRVDPFDFFQKTRKRDLYHAPLVHRDDARVDTAVQRARAWAEDGSQERSSFSFAKMFQCAVAVMASGTRSGLEPAAAQELVDLAISTGRAWAWDPERPTFFCAEFVVTAYGWEFARDALRPPDVDPHAPHEPAAKKTEKTASSSPPHLVDTMKLVENAWHYRPSPYQDWTMLQLLLAVRLRAPDFWREALSALEAYFKEAHPTGPDQMHFLEPTSLPGGLVTPRMIAASGLVGTLQLVPGGPGG